MDKSTDPLGYDVYAKTLWARIQTALNKDEGGKPLGDDPLVVGIFGEWGAGKSYLLNLIYKLAQKHSKVLANKRSADNVGARSDSGFEITIPVLFQPWKYEHEEHLHVPLLMHIIDAYAEVAVQAQTSDEAGDQLVKEYWNKAKPWLSLAWRRVLRPATESLAGQFSLKIKLAPEIEELAQGLNNLVTQLQKEREVEAEKTIKASADGHYFYRWHKVIQQLTRPWKFPELLKNDQGQAVKLEGQPRINFVVFIDDLDRCLPEKAVQTLELIKTVFNVESFAFVLALDDEVIERGIGHRYKEYKLQDKKPEMPITGFEYLEKIVHLPFRLPGLTQAQARRFIVQYEKDTVEKGQPLWFSQTAVDLAAEPEGVDIQKSGRTGMKIDLKSTELLDLVIASFDAYVPRKLIRTVELLRQVMKVVQQAHGKSITADGKPLDIRVILALLLMQLFQPELYRLVRRRSDVFPALYGGFVRKELFYPISDIDLWKWVTDFQVKPVRPSANKAQSKLVDALNPYEATVERIADIELSNDKADAQYVRLPLVTQLVEHRAVQRHVFNALRMTKDLAKLLYPIETLGEFSFYLNLLSVNENPTNSSPIASVPKDQRQRFAVGDIQRLLEDLTSRRAEVYENLAERHELKEGQVLDRAKAKSLVADLKIWLQSLPVKESKQSNKPRHAIHKDRQTRLLRGLQFLAPYISQEDGAAFWALVSELGNEWLPKPNRPNKTTRAPFKASLYLDVQSMLNQDDRFDRDEKTDDNGKTFKPLYLLKNRWNDKDEKQEPIPGFVRIPSGTYPVGQPGIPIDGYELEYDIYMGRTPVTVDQYSAFIADGGYGENANDEKAKQYWDDLGWAWRHNTEAYQIKLSSLDEKSRHFSEYRAGELRALPWDWANQQRIGSRAVRGINWFEARAYVRWLNTQLKQRGVFSRTLANYGATLPNESEWEIAARAQTREANDWNHWPWGNDDGLSGQRANISPSHIDHVSVPGCFAPNAWGLLDMAGNVFEWQDLLFSNNPYVSTVGWKASGLVPTSGSSFFTDLNSASCSSRGENPAFHGGNYVGLRVMLSQRGLNN